ncbi:helix-turn-helix domain-containing protein [Derxia lacustris]|uniref:hypothetical protein n=1 Tax=Derxia lacustris TaxID=764842 RepID=UPI000A172D10|nr:hypothetical protein [Derxia lacustris]
MNDAPLLDALRRLVCVLTPEQCDIDHALWSRRALARLAAQLGHAPMSEREAGLLLKRWGLLHKKPAAMALGVAGLPCATLALRADPASPDRSPTALVALAADGEQYFLVHRAPPGPRELADFAARLRRETARPIRVRSGSAMHESRADRVRRAAPPSA